MNTKHLGRALMGAIVGLTMVGAAACDRDVEREDSGFDGWDRDRDGFLSDDEYRERDRDRDGRISRIEFEADD